MTKRLCIFGAGGMGREALLVAQRLELEVCSFIDPHHGGHIDGIPVEPESAFDPQRHSALIALGNPAMRKRVVKKLLKLKDVDFPTLIDPDALLLHPETVTIGHGSLICARSVITRDVVLGSWCQINIGSYLGHDLSAGDFFTTAFGVNISGRNYIGRDVMLGAGCSTRDGVAISSEITVGAGACVVSDLTKPGVYVGVPAKPLGQE